MRSSLALALVLGLAAPVLAQGDKAEPKKEEPKKPEEKTDLPADTFCPVCRRPVTWEQTRCKCGAVFEPAVPRTLKRAPAEKPPEKPAKPSAEKPASKPGEEESPFPAPPPGAAPDKEEPGTSIIPSPWKQIQPPEKSRFGFGSYGRAGLEVDPELRGSKPLDLVDFRPRLGKSSYQELHFFYKDVIDELPILIKSTLAFNENIFAYNGDFDARMALRELYVEMQPTEDFAVWAGARMYRGDDIYLFDFWPLDDQNTLGVGAAFRFLEYHRIQVHVGGNRIIDPANKTFFQFQTIDVPLTSAVGTRSVVFLDRNRGVATGAYSFDASFLKFKTYGELHYLPTGHRQLANGTAEKLPADHGFLIGGELGGRFKEDWGNGFANIFVTYAKGLGAYDELSIPFGFDTDLSVTRSDRFLVGMGAALDTEYFGIHFGGYWQKFTDSDGIPDANDSTQWAVAARPQVYFLRYGRAGIEASFQSKAHEGVFPETGQKETQTLTKLSFLLGLAPEAGVYSRPEILIYYTFNWLNRAAQLELGRERLKDRPHAQEEAFGFVAEWWF